MPDVQAKSSQPPDWAARTLAAEFEPLPQVGPLQAARRYWLLVLLPVLVFVPLAAVVAAKRPATYTAEARLIVGRLNISTAGAIQGFAGAAQDLASTYPLVIYAAGVVNPVAHELGTTPADVTSRLTATEVPSTSIVRVIATGPTADDATTLANAASRSLVSYLTKFDRASPDLAYLHRRLVHDELAYQKASAAFTRASTSAAHTSLATTSTGSSPGDGSRALTPALQKLAAAADVAKIQLGATSTDYQNTVQNQATSSLLQPLVDANSASSDRQSKLQISVFIALLAGLLVGLALATLRANQVARRTLMAPSWAPDGMS